ncbi:hypothetical protein [Acinetobacter sp. RF14B]|uniref:hypothetical protein n=1 Tax=Acinetobacter sp. RF14B TaxID=2650965 RepID=UPI00116B3D4B|nr:hypothetical protein [Acinetobacter sp. RF14B]TQR72330.1 hypothetical protein E2K52_01495 [Acinetobacter sp. RF14B]
MEYLLQRLCWNSNGYQYPAGKTIDVDKGFAGTHGFGYEEWNFNTNDLIEGLCYGYMYQTPKNFEGKKFNIFFFSKDNDGRDWLIGLYKEAKFLSEKQRVTLEKKFKKSEIFIRRKQELINLGINKRLVNNYILGETKEEKFIFPLNISICPQKIILLDKPILMSKLVKERLNYHYTTAENITGKNKLKKLSSIFDDLSLANLALDDDRNLNEISYIRSANNDEKLIKPLHNKLSNDLKKYLLDKGFIDIEQEKNAIDLTAKRDDSTYMFELKVVNTPYVRHSIREALGQLLEYNYYPNRKKFNYLNIVLNRKPSDLEIEWCKKINKMGVRFELFWQNFNIFECAELRNDE